jgi:hypothetical protein
MSEYIQLSPAEKEEIRRLTQKANRRIKSYLKVYEQAGYKVIPKEVTAGLQIQSRQQFQTDNYAISRSVKFESKADYKKHISMLKKFDPGRADSVPTVREYNVINRTKLMKGFETAGVNLSSESMKAMKKWDSAKISQFWKDYQRIALRKGLDYASGTTFEELMASYDLKEKDEVINKSIRKVR